MNNLRMTIIITFSFRIHAKLCIMFAYNHAVTYTRTRNFANWKIEKKKRNIIAKTTALVLSPTFCKKKKKASQLRPEGKFFRQTSLGETRSRRKQDLQYAKKKVCVKMYAKSLPQRDSISPLLLLGSGISWIFTSARVEVIRIYTYAGNPWIIRRKWDRQASKYTVFRRDRTAAAVQRFTRVWRTENFCAALDRNRDFGGSFEMALIRFFFFLGGSLIFGCSWKRCMGPDYARRQAALLSCVVCVQNRD